MKKYVIYIKTEHIAHRQTEKQTDDTQYQPYRTLCGIDIRSYTGPALLHVDGKSVACIKCSRSLSY